MRVWFTRTLSGCVAADSESHRVLAKFPPGTTFEGDVKTRQARSVPWNRRYWLLLGRLAEHVSEVNIRELGDSGKPLMMPVQDSKSLHIAMKLICGLSQKYTVESAVETLVVRVPDSIAFDAMEADEWAAYWPRVLDAVHQRVLPGVGNQFIEDDLARLAS
jgi:hypothetical protein